MGDIPTPAAESIQRVLELARHDKSDQSDTLLREVAQQFPNDHAIALALCYRVMQKGILADTLRQWTETRLRFPHLAEAVIHNAGALMDAGRFAEAEALLFDAAVRFPENPAVLIARGYAAARRQDWREAAVRWRTVLDKLPLSQEALNGLGTAQQHLSLELFEQGAASQVVPAPDIVAAAEEQVLLRFENLGDNCEFGFVQRRYRAEPLGLLRWSSIRYHDIIGALDSQFAALDDDSAAHLSSAPGEQMLLIDALGFRTHSGAITGDVDPAILLRRQMSRLRFLRDKLVSDLRRGEKAFVFKNAHGEMDDDMIAELLRAVRRYGTAPLLCVRLADDANPVGMVEPRANGLLVGYIDRVTNIGNALDINYDAWMDVCRNAMPYLA